MSDPSPFPTPDPWDGTDEQDDCQDPEEYIPGIDGCHHGKGFDEDCEDCADELGEELSS